MEDISDDNGRMKFDVLDFPIVMPSSDTSLSYLSWSFESLSNVLKDRTFSCRVWEKSDELVLETACHHVNVTMKQFHDWLQQTDDCNCNNPLSEYGRLTHAAYIDYKYMKDVFSDHPEMMEKVKWSGYGLPDFDGKDSTIWIGSDGANTPGHQDSYGFNLVNQVRGRKLWVLFPPSDTEFLYPTRIPYEESSVFSQVHLGCPDIDTFPNIKFSHPVVVVLHPGQSLYVPRHWWHYVESIDPSISINVWVPHIEDSSSHLTESITRYIATAVMNEMTQTKSEGNEFVKQLLNPTETILPQNENINYIKFAVEKLLKTSSFDFESSPYSRNEKEVDGNMHLNKFNQWLRSFTILQSSGSLSSLFCPNCGKSFGELRRNDDVAKFKNSHDVWFVDDKSAPKSRSSTDGLNNESLNKNDSDLTVTSLKRRVNTTESSPTIKKVKGDNCFTIEISNLSVGVTAENEKCREKIHQSFQSMSNQSTSHKNKALPSSKPTSSSLCVFSMNIPCTFGKFYHFMKCKIIFGCKHENLNIERIVQFSEMSNINAGKTPTSADHQDDVKEKLHDNPNSIKTSDNLLSSLTSTSCVKKIMCDNHSPQEMNSQSTTTFESSTDAVLHSPQTVSSSIEILSSSQSAVPGNNENKLSSLHHNSTISNNLNSSSSNILGAESDKIDKQNMSDVCTSSSKVKVSLPGNDGTFVKSMKVCGDVVDDCAKNTDITSSMNTNCEPDCLSQNEIHKLLIESLIHPSVVDKISSLFKTKVETFLSKRNGK